MVTDFIQVLSHLLHINLEFELEHASCIDNLFEHLFGLKLSRFRAPINEEMRFIHINLDSHFHFDEQEVTFAC